MLRRLARLVVSLAVSLFWTVAVALLAYACVVSAHYVATSPIAPLWLQAPLCAVLVVGGLLATFGATVGAACRVRDDVVSFRLGGR